MKDPLKYHIIHDHLVTGEWVLYRPGVLLIERFYTWKDALACFNFYLKATTPKTAKETV